MFWRSPRCGFAVGDFSGGVQVLAERSSFLLLVPSAKACLEGWNGRRLRRRGVQVEIRRVVSVMVFRKRECLDRKLSLFYTFCGVHVWSRRAVPAKRTLNGVGRRAVGAQGYLTHIWYFYKSYPKKLNI